MKKKVNLSLYSDNHPKTSTKGTGFKDKQKALDTLNIIKDRDITPCFYRNLHLPKISKIFIYTIFIFVQYIK